MPLNTFWQPPEGLTDFGQYLLNWMWHQQDPGQPPLNVAQLAARTGIHAQTIWGWFRERRMPTQGSLMILARGTGLSLKTLYEVCGYAYPTEFAAPAPASAAPPHPARGEVRTPEEDIRENMELIRRNRSFSPEARAAIIEIMERQLQGYSVAQQLHDEEHVVEGVSSTFVRIPPPAPNAALDLSTQETQTLDALPARPKRPPQRAERRAPAVRASGANAGRTHRRPRPSPGAGEL